MKRLGSIGVFVAGTLCGGLLNLQPWNAVHAVNGEGRQDDGGFTGGAGVCPADIAPPGGDGVVNVDDLLAVISNWGPCVSDDLDNDGWSAAEGDCDDANANVHPGAPELCNGLEVLRAPGGTFCPDQCRQIENANRPAEHDELDRVRHEILVRSATYDLPQEIHVPDGRG